MAKLAMPRLIFFYNAAAMRGCAAGAGALQ
jgi:hypothetical protein